MARHKVVWIPAAENDLATLWLNSQHRKEVNQAAASLEKQITDDPLHTGESRQSTLQRIVMEPPIGIVFEVIPDDYRVIVLSVFPFS